MKSFLEKRYLISLLVFIVLGIVALQINLTHIAGSKVNFTMFDSFGPIASSILGTIPGTIALILLQLFNVLVHKQSLTSLPLLLHFIPILGAALYFRKKNWANWIIPLLAIVAFNFNPVGRSVWYYSLFWLIPIASFFLQERFLWARSLGATFTAHAIGGALWVWLIPLPREVWIGLIPIVAVERLLLAIGMMISYLAVKGIISGWLGQEDARGVKEETISSKVGA